MSLSSKGQVTAAGARWGAPALLLAIAGLQGCGSGADTRTNGPPAGNPTPTPAWGLDERPQNSTCVAWERPAAGSSISLSQFTSLSFSSPIAMLQAPGDASRWFVVEQGGAVRKFNV